MGRLDEVDLSLALGHREEERDISEEEQLKRFERRAADPLKA
jgi:hypothetical protein